MTKIQLPFAEGLPIHLLAACFNKTSATYKYYWLLSIIQSVENEKILIPKKDLFAGMISHAWYTVNYFHVSFGKQDQIQQAIFYINELESIPINGNRDFVFHQLTRSKNGNTESKLWHFDKNVPHWFLSPWFPKLPYESEAQRKVRIYQESKTFENQCLYSVYADHIEVNPQWINYLRLNSRLLKDYCFWNLALFLQSRNPSVPDITGKLIKPAIRHGLQKQRKKFWDIVIQELGSIECIYTGEKLTEENYAMEHFVPYSFVSHDLIWNLIPADISFNCSKNDRLPSIEKYFKPFYDLQKQAIEIVKHHNPNNRFLEDYLTIFPDTDHFTEENFKERIQPLITIASNNGFTYF